MSVDFHAKNSLDTVAGGWGDEVEENIRLRLCPDTTAKKLKNLIKKVRASKENASTPASRLGWGVEVTPVLRCDLCGNDEQENFIVDRTEGDTICLGRDAEGCGNVISERAVHMGNPHRTLEDDSTDKRHHGAVPLASLSESAYFRLNNVKNSECKHRLLATSKFKKMAQAIEWGFSSTGTDIKCTRMEYKDQEIEKAMATFANVCHSAVLSMRVANVAVAHFAPHRRACTSLHNVRGVYAACLILALRQTKAFGTTDRHQIASAAGKRNTGEGGRDQARTTTTTIEIAGGSVGASRPKWVPPPPPKESAAAATKRKYSSLFFTPSAKNAQEGSGLHGKRRVKSRTDSDTRKAAAREEPCTRSPQLLKIAKWSTPVRHGEDSHVIHECSTGGKVSQHNPSMITGPPEEADFANLQAFQEQDEDVYTVDAEWLDEQHCYTATSTKEERDPSRKHMLSVNSEQDCDKGQSPLLCAREPGTGERQRRQRMCEKALAVEIKRAFGGEEGLTFAQLNARLNQPEKYLKGVLSRLCVVERKKALIYRLKPEATSE